MKCFIEWIESNGGSNIFDLDGDNEKGQLALPFFDHGNL